LKKVDLEKLVAGLKKDLGLQESRRKKTEETYKKTKKDREDNDAQEAIRQFQEQEAAKEAAAQKALQNAARAKAEQAGKRAKLESAAKTNLTAKTTALAKASEKVKYWQKKFEASTDAAEQAKIQTRLEGL